jgi:hypothetical protein
MAISFLNNCNDSIINNNNITGDILVHGKNRFINITENNLKCNKLSDKNPGDNIWDSNFWYYWDCRKPKLIDQNIYDSHPNCYPITWWDY